MIDIKSLSAEWLSTKQANYKKDPSIMESMIYALYLLEQLQLTGLDFIFKGGTSLLLLLEAPSRFSVDIDIIVKPSITQEELEKHLSKIIASGIFSEFILDEKRSYKKGIPKAHYKFIYKSNVSSKSKENQVLSNPEREILLDVLFETNPYQTIIESPIKNDWIIIQDKIITVSTPDINSITGDKLTAFAPNTIGVKYKVDKEKEIIKQLYDLGCLFNVITNIEILKKTYRGIAQNEINYRTESKIEIEHALKDKIETALILAKGDMQSNDEDRTKFAELKTGVNHFAHYVYIGKFSIVDAQLAGAKVAYLAAIILSDHKGNLKIFDTKVPLADYIITHPDYNFLNKRLKFIAQGEALFYWNEVVKLLYS